MGNGEKQCLSSVKFRARERTKTQDYIETAFDGRSHVRLGSLVY